MGYVLPTDEPYTHAKDHILVSDSLDNSIPAGMALTNLNEHAHRFVLYYKFTMHGGASRRFRHGVSDYRSRTHAALRSRGLP